MWNFCARYSDVISREETASSVAKCWLFSQANKTRLEWNTDETEITYSCL